MERLIVRYTGNGCVDGPLVIVPGLDYKPDSVLVTPITRNHAGMFLSRTSYEVSAIGIIKLRTAEDYANALGEDYYLEVF